MDNSNSPKPLKKFTKEEVKQHNSEQSCWVIFDDKVYDVTAFLDDVRIFKQQSIPILAILATKYIKVQ